MTDNTTYDTIEALKARLKELEDMMTQLIEWMEQLESLTGGIDGGLSRVISEARQLLGWDSTDGLD